MTDDRDNKLENTAVIDPSDTYPKGTLADFEENETRKHSNIPPSARELEERTENRKPYLVCLSGIEIGRSVAIGSNGVAVGRGVECELVLDDNSVSRRHAQIVPSAGGGHQLRDLGSTNGTFVGEERVREYLLREGDRIVFGLHSVYKYVFHDALEKDYQSKLYNASVRDPLTGIFNRKYLDQKLLTDLSYTRRHRNPLTFVLADLDFFKKVNDTYGHPTGDQVLIAIAEVLGSVVRSEDVLGRFGGEEFALIAPGTNQKGAENLAERLRAAVAAAAISDTRGPEEKISVTISIGTATVDARRVVSAEDLISEADRNLYRAKSEGRNRVFCTCLS